MIAFIGLSHLGITYSLAAAAKGFDVLAYDPDTKLCHDLASGKFPIAEPGLEELFAAHQHRIRYTSQTSVLKECELAFFSPDIKTDEHNCSDLQSLRQLIESIASYLTPGCTVTILSQVTPGFTREVNSWFEANKTNHPIYYQVETLIFGRALERALNPERFIIGCLKPDSTDPLPAVYVHWLKTFACPIISMKYESAELAKIAINMFLVSSITTTNTLADLCEKIGANWSEIAQAVRLDARIGPKAYLNPGLGLAGGNLERDLQTFRSLANEHGADWRLIQAWQENSEHRKHWVLQLVHEHLATFKKPCRIAIGGLAYKENTNSTKNSTALALIESLPDLEKRAYDPQVILSKDCFPNFDQCPTLLDCCHGADVLAIMTPWSEFRNIDLEQVSKIMKGNLILDPYAVLDSRETHRWHFKYFKLGSSN